MADSLLGRLGNFLTSRYGKADLGENKSPMYIGKDISIVDSYNVIKWDAFNEEQLIQLLTVISWVYADIQLLAKNTWSASFRIKKRGESRKMLDVNDHPFLDVYHNPNPWMTKSYLIGYLMGHLQTSRKGAFIFLAPDANTGELVEMWPINSHQIEPVKDKGNYVTKFIYFPKQEGAAPLVIDGRYIMWVRFADPQDYWASLPPFLAALGPAKIELGIQQSQDKLFNENRGLPLTLVSLDPDLSPPDFEIAKAQIQRDWQNEGSTIAVARAGQISVQSLGFTQNELQSILAQKMTRDQIDMAFFGYTIHSDGLTSGEGLKEMDKIMKEQVYRPLLILLQDHIKNQIINRFYEKDVFAVYEDPRTYDRALNIQESMIFSRWKTVNEMREIEGEAPLADPPMMPGLGDLPVPLANNSSFVSTLYGIGANVGEDARQPEVGNLSDFQDPESITSQMSRGDEPAIGNEISVKAVHEGVKAELKRYKTVARRNLERQGDALAREFTTDIIPPDMYAELTKGLRDVASEEEIQELFEPWLS